MIGMIVCSILITIALNVSDLESVDCTTPDKAQADTGTNGVGVFAIISTLAFVVFFAFGPGSIPWLITGELFTQGIKALVVDMLIWSRLATNHSLQLLCNSVY